MIIYRIYATNFASGGYLHEFGRFNNMNEAIHNCKRLIECNKGREHEWLIEVEFDDLTKYIAFNSRYDEFYEVGIGVYGIHHEMKGR